MSHASFVSSSSSRGGRETPMPPRNANPTTRPLAQMLLMENGEHEGGGGEGTQRTGAREAIWALRPSESPRKPCSIQ